jgi:hypothetical protein
MKKKKLEELWEIFRKNSGDKSTRTARHLSKEESQHGKFNKSVEKIGNTSGVFHITQENAIANATGKLKKELKGKSKKEYTEYMTKNPEVDAQLAGRFTKRLYKDLTDEGADLSNLTENEKAATIGNLYNYRKQPGIRKSVSKLSQDRFVKSPEYIREQQEEVAKNMDVTTVTKRDKKGDPVLDSKGNKVREISGGLVTRRNAEKKLFLDTQSEQKQDQVNKQDSSILKEESMVNNVRKPASIDDEEKEKESGSSTNISSRTVSMVEAQGSRVTKGIDPYTKEKVYKNAQDMDKVMGGGAKAEQASLEGKAPDVEDKFMQAIGFFMPAVIGGLVGGSMEGGEGAAAGVRLGLTASGEYNKAKNAYELNEIKKKEAEAKAAQGKKSKIDITPDFYNVDNDQPVFSRETEDGGAEFFDATGNVIDPSKVKSLKERQAKTRQASVQSRHQERMTDGFMKTWRKKADPDIEGIKNIDSITNLIDSDSPITTAQVATFNARALFKEVGRLSDDDVKRAVVGLPLYKKVKNNMHQYMTGTMTKEVKEITKELLRVAKKHQKKVLRNLVDKGMAPHRIKTSGLTKEEYREALLMNAEVDLSEEEEKKGGLSKEDRADLERLRAMKKRGEL